MKNSSLVLAGVVSCLIYASKANAVTAPSDCAVPSSPQKVVIGFSGWLSYFFSYGLIDGMLGDEAGDPNVDFFYYSWDSVVAGQMTDALQCAIALATTPYTMPDGSTAYSTIAILGHSFGGNTAYLLTAALGQNGISTNLVVTADPRDPSNPPSYAPTWSKPSSVISFLDFYETNDWFLPGFPVSGATNTQIGGFHLDAPANPTLISATSQAVANLPLSRRAYGP